MKIRYKTIEHERTEDAPFVGALISSIDCKFKCKGCFNRKAKLLPNIEREADEIIEEITSNPFNEGIIFGGLEWSLQPVELVELFEKASNAGLKIIIYTGCTAEEFYKRIGKGCADRIGFKADELSKAMMDDNADELFGLMGRTILDYYIKADYYLKTGLYDREHPAIDRVHFGVSLASTNQNIFLIKKTEGEEE